MRKDDEPRTGESGEEIGMHRILSLVALKSLSASLQRLSQRVPDEPELQKHLKTSLFFCNELEKNLQGLVREYEELMRQVYFEANNDPNEKFK